MRVAKYLVLLLLGLCGCQAPVAPEQPNILLIVADDLGYADLSFLPFAADDVATPGIDELASRGTYFSDAYATAPICSPSRAGLLTGRYQQRWGNYWFTEGGMPANERSLAQVLRDQGYRTKKIGKTHLNGGEAEHPLKHGFEEFFGFVDHTWDYVRLSEEDVAAYGPENAKKAHIGPLERDGEKVSFDDSYTTELFTEETLEYITRDDERPFFVQLSYNAVHHPTYVGHPEYLARYGLEQFPFWDPDEMPYGGGETGEDTWHYKWGWLGEVDPDGRKRYLATLDVLDDGIGAILEQLDASGLADNTVVFFVSDNGGTINTYSNNGPLHGYKYTFEEGGIRVPMIAVLPGDAAKGATNAAMVSLMDLFPTIVDLAGGEKPANLDGKSMLPLMQSDNVESRHAMLAWDSGQGDWVVRSGNWKLYHSTGRTFRNFKTEDGRNVRDAEYVIPGGTRLYDLSTDIGETTDLAAQHPEVVAELTRAYKAWRAEMIDPVPMWRK